MCDRNPNNDIEGVISNITQADLERSLIRMHTIKDKESLMQEIIKHYNEYEVPTGAQYALFFNNSGASTGPLVTLLQGTNLTIEFLFKPMSQGGTVLSFAKVKTFAVTINKTISLHFGIRVINTGILVELYRWSHVTVVWYSKEKFLQLYRFDDKRNVVRRRYRFLENPFPSGGILSLGQWQLSPGDSEVQTESVFCGVIDEVRLWKRLFDPVLIQQNFGMNVLPHTPGVAALWKFNEIGESTIKDLVNDEHLYVAPSPWKRPILVFSDAPVKHYYRSLENPFAFPLTGKPSEKETVDLCFRMFYKTDLFTVCKELSAELDMYYVVCVQNTLASGNQQSSINAVIAFADRCQAVLNMTYWPAKSLCNILPNGKVTFPDWIGTNCETKCVFGATDQTQRTSCKCLPGFWGQECDQMCPFGITRPCNDHGKCNSLTGTCSCDVNWRGNENCSSCSQGWYGNVCQFAASHAVLEKNYSIAVASVLGLGNFYGFDGIGFTLNKYGEFYIIQSNKDNFTVQIRQGVCVLDNKYHKLCTVSFAVHYKNSTVVLRAPITSSEEQAVPLVWVDSRPVGVNHETQLSPFFVMTRTSISGYSIKSTNGMVFDIRVSSSLSVTCYMPRIYCTNATGLLGSCLLQSNNSNYSNISNDTSYLENQMQIREENSKVSHLESLFIYKFNHFEEPLILTGAGFSLTFTDSFARSKPLYIQDIGIVIIELFVRIKSRGGVILSYAQGNTFALVNDKKLSVNYRGQDYTTGLTLDIGKWNQISLVFNQYLGTLQIYVFKSFNTFQVRVIQLDKDAWKTGGILALGQWLSSKDSSKPPSSNFYGTIDEVRIWKAKSSTNLAQRTWGLNIEPENYSDLLHLWKMNQVQGSVVKDLVGNCDLTLMKFHEPKWQFSDVNISLPSPQITEVNNVVDENAVVFCHSLFLNGKLFDRCRPIGTQVLEFFYQNCLRQIRFNLDSDKAIYSVISLADYCQSALHLVTWPAQELCNKFTKEQFPYWIGKRCDIACIFGKPEPSQNDTIDLECRCLEGYWGLQCENLCPGGLFNVCNGHGTCDQRNGTCSCEPRWRGRPGNAEESTLPCSVCTEGWIGADCNVAFTSNTTETGVAIGFGDPHFTTVAGLSYNLDTPGSFLFVNNSKVTVQILQTPCNNKIACRRISDLTLRTRTFLLRVAYDDLVTTNLHDFDRKLTHHLGLESSWTPLNSDKDSHYRWLTSNILEITLPGKMKVTLLFYHSTIGTAVEIPQEKKKYSFGLGGEVVSQWITSLANLTQANATPILTQNLLNTNLTSMVRPINDNNPMTEHRFDGAGYMLGFSNSHLYKQQDTFPILDEFTLELWLCLVNDASSIYNLCSDTKKKGNMSSQPAVEGKHAIMSITKTKQTGFAILYDISGFYIIWDNQKIRTNLTVREGIWNHIALTWRNNDGRLQMLIDPSSSNSVFSVYGRHIGKQLDMTGLWLFGKFGEHYNLLGALDEIRLWQFAKTQEEISTLRHVKFDYYLEGLLLSLPLDQGFGTKVDAFKYPFLNTSKPNQTVRNVTVVKFQANKEGKPPEWLPSGVMSTPLTNYIPTFFNDSLQYQARNLCQKLFYTGVLQRLCSSRLMSQAQFYFDACITDIVDGGTLEHFKLSISMFGFYCHKVLGVEECELHGTYDGFAPCATNKTNTFPLLIVVSIAAGVAMFFILLVVCCCIRRRRKKSQKKCKDNFIPEPEGNTYTIHNKESEGLVNIPLVASKNAEDVTTELIIHETGV